MTKQAVIPIMWFALAGVIEAVQDWWRKRKKLGRS